jgi:DNA-binding cell septation regulator SpoVG
MKDYSTRPYGFKRVVSPVMADIRKQIIPAIEQKSQNSDNWFRCTEQTNKS